MQAVILAATHEEGFNAAGVKVPRILLDLDKKPLLTVLIENLCAVPTLHRINVVTNEKIKPHLDAWAATLATGKTAVEILSDGTMAFESRKGAIGDLLLAIQHAKINEDLLIVGGDNYFTYDLAAFVERSRGHSPALVVTAMAAHTDRSRFGMIKLDHDNRITEFFERKEKPADASFNFKASCVYFFSAADLKWFDKFALANAGEISKYTPGMFMAWLVEKQVPVYGVEMQSKWYDIGELQGKNLKSPDFIEFRNILRSDFTPPYLTWEQEAERRLQWASSYDDLLYFVKHKDPNLRIVAARLLGRIGHLIDAEGKAEVIAALISLLNDPAMNEFEYGGSQDDEETDIYYVSATAAEALVRLGYAENEDAVFNKALAAGGKVEKRVNKMMQKVRPQTL